MALPDYLPQVRAQYEDYPYPARNPADERQRLIAPVTECLDTLNHYCFSGKKDFSKNFRALVAGGGTGDSVVFLAEQLRDTSAEIIYLDISQASMEVAKQRAAVRNLNNIQWHHGSLLDVASFKLGTFDYINCSGVLHHLASPERGLKSLTSVLKVDGAMGLMVYGQYGRAGVYQMQTLMRLLNQHTQDAQTKIENCKAVLNILPEGNAFKRTSQYFNDVKQFGDVGIYDLFLHSQDRAYTVPELYEWVEGAGLNILKLIGSDNQYGNRGYQLDTFIKNNPQLKTLAAGLDERSRQAAAELLHGQMKQHTFYAAKQSRSPATPDDLDMIPSLPLSTDPEIYEAIYNAVAKAMGTVILKSSTDMVQFKKTANAAGIFKYLDGKRSLREIFKLVMQHSSAKTTPNLVTLQKEFEDIYLQLNGEKHNNTNWLLLRHSTIPPYKILQEMQKKN